MRRLRSEPLGACPSAAAATVPRLEDRARRPDDALEAGVRDLVEVLPDVGVDVAHEAALIARFERIGLDEPLGQPDDAKFEAPAQLDRGAVPFGHLDAAAADVDDDDRIARNADPVDRRQMDEPGLFGSGNDTRPDAGLLRDGLQELAAVLGFPGRARCHGDNFIDLMGFGQTPEFRQHL